VRLATLVELEVIRIFDIPITRNAYPFRATRAASAKDVPIFVHGKLGQAIEDFP
jgi:hypothetical protein